MSARHVQMINAQWQIIIAPHYHSNAYFPILLMKRVARKNRPDLKRTRQSLLVHVNVRLHFQIDPPLIPNLPTPRGALSDVLFHLNSCTNHLLISCCLVWKKICYGSSGKIPSTKSTWYSNRRHFYALVSFNSKVAGHRKKCLNISHV